jgi:hypothetical protein
LIAEAVPMQPYANLAGDSGIVAYQIGDSFIRIRFHGSRGIYVYSTPELPAAKIERMKQLAAAGRGLATYISRNADVRNGYSSIEE